MIDHQSKLDPRVVLGNRVLFYGDWRNADSEHWPYKSFRPVELACKETGSLVLDLDAMDKLQTLRDYLSMPLVLDSAYRSPQHNTAIHGEPDSQHMLGKAFDIALSGHITQERLVAAAQRCGFTGIGLYDTFVHVDTGPSRTWDNRKGHKS